MTTVLQRLLIALLVGCSLVGIAVGVLRQPDPDVTGVALLLWTPVGAVLALRQPRNVLGWLFLGIGLLAAVIGAASAHLPQQAEDPEAVPESVALAGWVLSWAWYPLIAGTAVLTPMLFPDGWLSGAWRRLGVAFAAFSLFFTLALSTLPTFELGRTGQSIANPVVAGPVLPDALGAGLYLTGLLALLGGIGAGLVSLVLRYRRGDAVLRLQLRWFLAAAAVVLVAAAVDLALGEAYDELTGALVSFGLGLIPVAVGIAVTRHGLYEIDRLISRSVSYLLVTGAVVATYAVVVTSVTRLLPVSSSLGVAAATLAAAAVFRPVLHRARTAVDSRFDRERYNAQHTLEVLARELRDEVNPDAVAAGLLRAVDNTLQPVSLGIWMRGSR